MNRRQANMLVDLHELVLHLPKECLFDITSWADSGINDIKGKVTKRKLIDCNTSCCAVGWGITLLPSWKAAGFKWESDEDSIFPEILPALGKGVGRVATREFDRNAKHILGVTSYQWCQMFIDGTGSYGDVTVEDVAERIRNVLDAYDWEIS